jgi:hypothetical protein
VRGAQRRGDLAVRPTRAAIFRPPVSLGEPGFAEGSDAEGWCLRSDDNA